MDTIRDETVRKLTFLYVLDKMEIPLTENSIIEICTSRNDWLKYIDCKDVMGKLLAINFIKKVDDGDFEIDPREYRYTITEPGRECLSHFSHRIRQHIREEISEYAKQNRMVFKRSQEYVHEYFKNQDGSHTLVLKIKQPNLAQPIFEIRLRTETRGTAVDAGKKWIGKAAQIYEYVIENLAPANK